MQRGVVQALAHRDRSQDSRIQGLPAWALEHVAARAERQVEQIRASGVRVVGDPDRLRIAGRVQPADVPPEVDSVPLDLLADLVRGAVDGAHGMHRDEAAARGARPPSEAPSPSSIRLLGRRVGRRLGLRGR
jgi:hypothetical protein